MNAGLADLRGSFIFLSADFPLDPRFIRVLFSLFSFNNSANPYSDISFNLAGCRFNLFSPPTMLTGALQIAKPFLAFVMPKR